MNKRRNIQRALRRWCTMILAVAAAACGNPEVTRHHFKRDIANIEYSAVVMRPAEDALLRASRGGLGDLWTGRIMRRLPGDGLRDGGHYVPFAALYERGVATNAWCDTNLDGALTDERPLTLAVYQSPSGARSFLADLRWSAGLANEERAFDWKVRVVLEPDTGGSKGPIYRVQRVYGMTGQVTLEGQSHKAFLFDGNGDGLYTKAFLDGVYVDLDDDKRFDIDPFSSEFGPFVSPFPMGRWIYEVDTVDPDGAEVTLKRIATASSFRPPSVGELAPGGPFDDVSGRRIMLEDLRGRPVVIYFFATWCGYATDQAHAVSKMYAAFPQAGVEMLMVSFDADRVALDAFRNDHGWTWPTSFSGRALWDDPWGRAYRVRWPGVFFLIDAKGRLYGRYDDPAGVMEALARLGVGGGRNPALTNASVGSAAGDRGREP